MKGWDCIWVLNGSTSFQLYMSGGARDGDGQVVWPPGDCPVAPLQKLLLQRHFNRSCVSSHILLTPSEPFPTCFSIFFFCPFRRPQRVQGFIQLIVF